jgi:hypothetical protein
MGQERTFAQQRRAWSLRATTDPKIANRRLVFLAWWLRLPPAAKSKAYREDKT